MAPVVFNMGSNGRSHTERPGYIRWLESAPVKLKRTREQHPLGGTDERQSSLLKQGSKEHLVSQIRFGHECTKGGSRIIEPGENILLETRSIVSA